MKRMIALVLVLALALSMGGVSAFAAGRHGQRQGGGSRGSGQNWVDADGDGVCDNWASGGRHQNWVDADGDGVCDNWALGGRHQNWVDADGDSVCDNWASGGCRGRGWGRTSGWRACRVSAA